MEMREDIRSLKSGLHAERGESTTISKSSTVEALDLLENRLDSLEEKQKLVMTSSPAPLSLRQVQRRHRRWDGRAQISTVGQI